MPKSMRSWASALFVLAGLLWAGPALAASGVAFQPGLHFGPPPGIVLTTGKPTHGLMLHTPARVHLDPKYMRQVVGYNGSEKAGTIIVDTGHKFLYLVLGSGRAMRYGIGTAKDGFEWSGVHTITNKREWPDWTPPAAMLKRRPDIPHHMEGGLNNPLGARALYIGHTLYRIHGTNEPWTIGHDVSSGCIRLINDDVIDLYSRVKIGAKVIVM
jgi:lipoprotein-anchoring transpeptidase ErfK/SrfK